MLAALLLNLGAPKSTPPVRKNFGGGPFWRRYGYDRSYDAIRSSTSSAVEPIAEPVALVRQVTAYRSEPINYRVLETRVAESVAKDMRRLREEVQEEQEDEFMTILLLLGE